MPLKDTIESAVLGKLGRIVTTPTTQGTESLLRYAFDDDRKRQLAGLSLRCDGECDEAV
jgi:hypothetical protein